MGKSQIATSQLNLLRETMTSLVRLDGSDLTARQLAALLYVTSNSDAHTVRGLAAYLNISKPAVTRAIDRLEKFRLVRRHPDTSDRRSVLIRATSEGRNYIRRIGSIMNSIGAEPEAPVALAA